MVRFEYNYYEGYWMYPYNKLRQHGPSYHYTEKEFCESFWNLLSSFLGSGLATICDDIFFRLVVVSAADVTFVLVVLVVVLLLLL